MGKNRHNRRSVLRSAAAGLTGLGMLGADLGTSAAQEGFSHSLVIVGGSPGNVVTYEFRVSDRAEKSAEDHGVPAPNGVSINDEDAIDGQLITGAVAGGGDAYHYSGELQTLTVDGNARVYVDGSEVDPATVGNRSSGGGNGNGDGSGGGDGGSNDDAGGDGGQSSLAAEFEFDCFSVGVDAPSYTRVQLETTDGSTHEFTGNYSGRTEFGFAEAFMVAPENGFDQYHGDIATVTVTDDAGATATKTKPEADRCRLEIGCETVTTDYCAEQFSIYFRDGASKHYLSAALCHADSVLELGSPGRVVESIDTIVGMTIQNTNANCSASSQPATTFECTEVTIEPEEFTYGRPTFAGATLTFTDGTSQTFGVRDPIAEGGNNTDSYTAPATFAGTGEHEGKIITEVQVAQVELPIVFTIPNHNVDACVQNAQQTTPEETTTTSTTETTATTTTTETTTPEDTPTPTPTPTPEDTPTPTPVDTPTPTPEEEAASTSTPGAEAAVETETAGLLGGGLVGAGLRRLL